MTTRDEILQAVRAWFTAAIPLTDAANQIIPSNLKGPRPDLPYLTVNIPTADQGTSVDETRHAIDAVTPPPPPGEPAISEWRVKGQRAGTIDIQSHDNQGATTGAGWLEDAVLQLQRPAIQAILDAAGLSIVNFGEVLDISSLLDNEIERRHLRTIEVRYAVGATGVGLPELLSTETSITLERYESHPDPLDVDITVDLT